MLGCLSRAKAAQRPPIPPPMMATLRGLGEVVLVDMFSGVRVGF